MSYCYPKKQFFSLCILIPMGLTSLLLENWVGVSSIGRNYWLSDLKIGKSHNATTDSNTAKALITPNESLDATVDTATEFTGLAIVGAFNHQRDVFKRSQVPVNATFAYIQSWYESLQMFPSMQGFVLHNMFSEEQTKAWRTDQIHFVRVSNQTASFKQAAATRRPINDMRFFVLNEFLTRLYGEKDGHQVNQQQSSSPQYVLFSDSYDVRFLRNPFEYMKKMDDLMGGSSSTTTSSPQIFVGEEYAYRARKNIWDEWMNKSSTQCFGKPLPASSRMINCGLVGGRIDVVLELLKRLTQMLKSANPGKVCDQISLYYTLSKHYQDKYLSGYPFNSQFSQWEGTNDTLAYIAHK